MKKLRLSTVLGIVVAVAIVAALIGVLARNSSSSKSSDFVIENGVLTKYEGSAKNVSIPKDVRSIASFAFLGHSEIQRVKMPNTVSTIGQGAFYGCSALKSITLSNTLTYIDDGAFGECDSLTSFTIPASVQFVIEGAFYGSDNIEKFIVADGNQSFKAVDGVLYVADNSALVAYPAGRSDTSYTIADGVGYIAAWAFHCADSLETVTIPETVTGIGEECFYNSGLTAVKLPAALEQIGIGAFYNCAGLREVEIPDGVETISARAFADCAALTTVKLPTSVTQIAQMAFSGCVALQSVNIPAGLLDIHENSFSGCENVTLHVAEGSFVIDYAEALGLDYVID